MISEGVEGRVWNLPFQMGKPVGEGLLFYPLASLFSPGSESIIICNLITCLVLILHLILLLYIYPYHVSDSGDS